MEQCVLRHFQPMQPLSTVVVARSVLPMVLRSLDAEIDQDAMLLGERGYRRGAGRPPRPWLHLPIRAREQVPECPPC